MSNVCGTGGWQGPLPGDPDNFVTISATPAFGGIDVTWTMPSLNPFAVAHVLLYRGMSSNPGTALEIAAVGGNFYYDKRDTGTTYFYWLKIVSINGTVGDLVGPASATAKPLIADLIEQLTGEIDSGLLATSLKTQLDQISILNSNLLNEVTDRESGEITLAEAIEAVNLGVAEAHTFILDEIDTRVSENAALVESIDGVVATLDTNIAAVVTSMAASVDSTTGLSTAMYMAKVTVNGLVGGFGLLNNGSTVESGFDVDKFWIGRTNADKRKPFIIDGGVVYIDDAVIRSLTFSKLRDEAGSFIVEGGKVKADYLNIRGLSVQAADGTVLLSAGVPLPEAYTTQSQYQAEISWNFNDSANGWYNLNQAALTPNPASLSIVATGTDPEIASPVFSVYGAGFYKVRVKIRRTGGTGWEGTLFYKNAAHNFSGSFYKYVPTVVTSEWQVIEWDMSALSAGGSDWIANTITELRFDFGANAGDNFEVDWIAVGSTSPGSYGAQFGKNISGQITPSSVSTYVADDTIGIDQLNVVTIPNLASLSATIGTLQTSSTGQRSKLTDSGLQIYNSAGVEVISLGIF